MPILHTYHYATCRYRWVVACDYDEYLLPKMHPAAAPAAQPHAAVMGYSELFKRIRADPKGLLDPSTVDFGQEEGAASWPVSFMWVT